MSNEVFPQPSEGELDILQVLWKIEPATVRQVHELLSASKPVGYTTTLKQMQRMLEKNLLSREDREGGHYYRCTLPQQHKPGKTWWTNWLNNCLKVRAPNWPSRPWAPAK